MLLFALRESVIGEKDHQGFLAAEFYTAILEKLSQTAKRKTF